jgi:hypothetical protein
MDIYIFERFKKVDVIRYFVKMWFEWNKKIFWILAYKENDLIIEVVMKFLLLRISKEVDSINKSNIMKK